MTKSRRPKNRRVQTAEKRRIATLREKERQRKLGEAFESLANVLPWNRSDAEQRSQKQILYRAIEYIGQLRQVLEATQG
ncbi:hypothetical protein B9Z55_011715 [Caenorhabditis nigoni]|uniref:BHLH domain-containing protein n=1 Tax=Caenorhabditis nigoni TaxID=1611254 RepID=A0A2G5UM65_9PELO|nr:hypothetical protein B9Z55_011715 [Caenorhabditis nigoni]